jgi:hypothetical protein
MVVFQFTVEFAAKVREALHLSLDSHDLFLDFGIPELNPYPELVFLSSFQGEANVDGLVSFGRSCTVFLYLSVKGGRPFDFRKFLCHAFLKVLPFLADI